MKKKLLSITIITVILSFTNICYSVQNSYQIEAQKKVIDKKLDTLDKQKKDEQKKLDSITSAKNSIEDIQKQERKAYYELIVDKRQAERDLKAIDKSISEAIKKYAEQKELFKKRLVVMYENSNKSYMQTIAESKDFVDLLSKIEIVSNISKKDKEIIKSLSIAKKDIEYKKSKRELEKAEIEKKANQKVSLMNKIKAEKQTIEKEMQNINIRLEQLDNQENELLKKSSELENSIKSLQRNGIKYSGGKMTWPSPSCRNISSPFGLRTHPILKTNKMHTGIDISAQYDSSVVAVNTGTIIIAGWQDGYGNTVVIDHGGGITSLYAHCSRILVSVGDKVDGGTTISKVGTTGFSTGPHLHFEIRNNGIPKNPLEYI